jgi:hypothetical protein
MNWEGYGGRMWLIIEIQSWCLSGRERKTMATCQDSQFPSQDSNWIATEYKSNCYQYISQLGQVSIINRDLIFPNYLLFLLWNVRCFHCPYHIPLECTVAAVHNELLHWVLTRSGLDFWVKRIIGIPGNRTFILLSWTSDVGTLPTELSWLLIDNLCLNSFCYSVWQYTDIALYPLICPATPLHTLILLSFSPPLNLQLWFCLHILL